jgi:hypothetical protein
MAPDGATPQRRHRIVTPIQTLKSAWPEAGIATVAGRVVRLLGRSDGALVALDDGTAWLEVWVPSRLDPCGDVAIQAQVELDVRKGAGAVKWPHIDFVDGRVQDAIQDGDVTGARATAIQGFAGQDFTDAQAIALAVRSPRATIRRQMTRLGQVLVLALAVALAAVRFVAIDAASTSASDTLRPWLVQASLIALIAGGLIFLIQQYEGWRHRRH